jgi:putative Holliday junction resolvase
VRRGVRIGVDVGSVRVGVARCDPEGLLATPIATLARGAKDLDELRALVVEEDAVEVVVGLPLHLSGKEGTASAAARTYARELAERIAPTEVRLVDERLSTVGAARGLRDAGIDTRRGRMLRDQAAAVIILQSALDLERATGHPAGELVVVHPAGADATGAEVAGLEGGAEA